MNEGKSGTPSADSDGAATGWKNVKSLLNQKVGKKKEITVSASGSHSRSK